MLTDTTAYDTMRRRGDNPAATVSDAASISSPDRIARMLLGLGLAALILPLVAAATVLLSAGLPELPLQIGDRTLIEIHTRATLAGELPLVGPYSRFGFYHPGPLMYYLYAGFYWAAGGDSTSLPLAALTLNAAGLIGLVLIVLRAAGRRAAAWAAILSVVWVTFSSGALLDSWNPYISIIPFLAACVALAAFAGGLNWAAGVAALAATLALQSHVGYALSLLGAAAAAILLRLPRMSYSRSQPRGSSRWALVGIGAALVAWVPPIVQQLTGEPGNLTTLVRFFVDHPGQKTWAETLRLAPTMLASFPFGRLLNPGGGMVAFLLVIQLFLVALATRWAIRSQKAFLASLGILTLVMHVTAVLSMHAIVGPTESYLIHWMTGVGFLSWLLIGSVAIELPDTIAPAVRRGALAGLMLVGASCSIAATRDLTLEARALMTGQPEDAAWREITESCLRIGLERGWSGWVVRSVDHQNAWGWMPDLANRLRKGGLPIVVEPEHSWYFPASYRPTGAEGGTLLVGTSELLDQHGNSTGFIVGHAGKMALRAEPYGTPLEGTWSFALLPAISPEFSGFTRTYLILSEAYRWSNGAESRMKVPLRRGTAHRLTLEVMPYVAADAAQVLTISIDGHSLASIPLRMEKVWQRVEVDLPADGDRDWRDLHFAYARTHSRSDVALTGDESKLGVAFRTLTVQPLPATLLSAH